MPIGRRSRLTGFALGRNTKPGRLDFAVIGTFDPGAARSTRRLATLLRERRWTSPRTDRLPWTLRMQTGWGRLLLALAVLGLTLELVQGIKTGAVDDWDLIVPILGG